MSDSKTEYVILKKSIWSSFAEDFFIFGCLAATVWFNVNYCGNSYFLDAIILWGFVVACSTVTKIYSCRFYTKESAIKHIQGLPE